MNRNIKTVLQVLLLLIVFPFAIGFLYILFQFYCSTAPSQDIDVSFKYFLSGYERIDYRFISWALMNLPIILYYSSKIISKIEAKYIYILLKKEKLLNVFLEDILMAVISVICYYTIFFISSYIFTWLFMSFFKKEISRPFQTVQLPLYEIFVRIASQAFMLIIIILMIYLIAKDIKPSFTAPIALYACASIFRIKLHYDIPFTAGNIVLLESSYVDASYISLLLQILLLLFACTLCFIINKDSIILYKNDVA